MKIFTLTSSRNDEWGEKTENYNNGGPINTINNDKKHEKDDKLQQLE